MPRLPQWVRRKAAQRANPNCAYCHGDGLVTYAARNVAGEVELLCACVHRDDMRHDDDPTVN